MLHFFLFLGSLLTPDRLKWWSQVNIAVGFVLMFWVIAPILYCNTPSLYSFFFHSSTVTVTNVWNSAHFPISGRTVFDNTGSPYIAQNIITNGVLDPVKYAGYSPVFLPTILAVVYGGLFAVFPAILMHMFCKFLFCFIMNNIYHKF